MAKKEYVCIKECFVYNKRFKKGAKFPETWLKEGYLPNQFFLPEDEAKEYIREHDGHRPVQCAGDDPRSTEEIKKTLFKFMKSFPEKWGRKEMWSALRKYEQGEAQTGDTKDKGK